MRKGRILIILGIWTAIIPFTGFPYSWKDVLTTLTGLVFIYFGYSFYQEHKKESGGKFDSFSENGYDRGEIGEGISTEIKTDSF